MEKREERVAATRPVKLDRGTGITRNVSASGVFFETDVEYAAGSEISITTSALSAGVRSITAKATDAAVTPAPLRAHWR